MSKELLHYSRAPSSCSRRPGGQGAEATEPVKCSAAPFGARSKKGIKRKQAEEDRTDFANTKSDPGKTVKTVPSLQWEPYMQPP